MFPHKSSSYAISSKANAFVQNFKVEGESRVVVGVGAVAVLSASREESAQPPISCCTYQVPVSSVRDAVSVSVSVMIPEQSNQIKCSHTVGCERRVVGQATRGKEGRGAGPLLPLAVQPPTSPSSPLLFFYLSPCSRLAFVEAASVIITSSTTTVSTTLGVDDDDDLMIMMMMTTARCSSPPSTPSALTFELKVSNAMVASGGNQSGGVSAQIGHPHPTNNLASNNLQLLPHITSQAKATATTTTHKFGAPYFHNNNPTDGENDDRFKIVCVNDECTSYVRSCPPAATEHTNIPMQERENSVAATVGQKSFKYHCDHNDSVSNNNCNTSDKINVGVSEYEMYARRWGIAAPRLMRLAGGGESSLNNSSAAPGGGGAGWGGGAGGGNAAQNNNNANQQTGSWGGNAAAQQQQTGGGSAPQQQNNNGSGGAQWGGSGGGNGGQGRQTGAVAGAGAQPTSQQQANTAQQNNSGNNSGMKPAVTSGGGPAANNQQQSQQPTSTSQQQQPNNNQPNNQQQAGNNNTNNNGGQQQQNGGGSWAAAAGKGLAASTPPPPASSSAASGAGSGGGNGAAPASASTAAAAAAQQAATNKQLEQLNTMRESLFSLDGWGGQHVNQDSTWDIPPSPEPPSNKDGSGGGGAGGGTGNGAAPGAGGGAPVWKPNINNGTELWEANLRNGGQVPVVVGGGAGGAGGSGGGAQKTPWGHTPSSNLGGTWGVEDDDLSDATNVWTGVPPPGPPQQQPPPQQQQQPPPQQWGNSQPNTPIWAAPKKENDWGGGGGSQWGGGGGGGGGDHMMMRGGGGGRGGDMGGWPPQQPPPHHPSQPPHPLPPHHQMPPNKMPPNANVNQWPGPPPKDMGGMGKGGGGPSGWEEPSPPAQRRNIPNYDDGTSLWGAQQQRNAMPGQNKVSHWKEMPSPASMVGGRGGGMGGGQMGPGGGAMPVGRMPTKDGPLWGGGGGSRNGAWDGGHEVVGGGPWDDGKQQVGPGGQWGGGGEVGGWKGGGPKQMQGNPSASWGADGGPPLGDGPLPLDPSSWAHPPKQPLKPLTKEIIWASKQFRILSEMGFEKDKVETALRTFNMSLEDAIEYLNAANCPRGGGDWGRGGGGGGRGHSPPPVGPPPPFDAQPPPPPQFAAAAASQRGGGQGGGGGFNPPIPGFVPPSQLRPSNQQPASNQQLRMLVQQIQLAVTAGYLNHQILNQPLAPQTLLLLNQLLQQIKLLHQLQHALQQNPMAKNSNSLGMSVQITKTKQQITNLQNQISAQQAIYVKLQQNPQQQAHQQQQQQQQLSQNDFFGGAGKGNPHDPLAALQSNFADLALKESQSQQSRLSQWKLPSLPSDKDDDFSRAPGSVAKSGAAGGNSSPNALNPLLSQPDTTWSVGRSSDTGWPDSSSNHHDGGGDKDWPGAVTGVGNSQSAAASFTDLVPEFEPGKPWKGNQMKSIEDDPTITPGSLQQASAVLTPKGNSVVTSVADDMFGRGGGGGGKVSPPPGPMAADMPPIPSLSLSSSTWSFQPTSQSSFNSPLSKMSMSGGGVGMKTSSQGVGWGGGGGGDPHGGGADMWKSRQGGGGGGPPPGLSKTLPPTAAPSNGWGSLSGRWGPPQHTTWGQPPPAHALWLLLKNLTPQIDGSTLKTLCVQHGPLQSFHMYLPHGIAFAKYSTREEATKAQNALNNCVLGNTTIFADVQPEREIVALLNQLGNSGGGGGGNSQAGAAAGDGNSPWSSSRQPQPKQVVDTWGSGSQLWGGGGGGGGGTSSSLWGAALDSDRSTPSTASLNSFLPPDLLGGESM